MCERLLLALLAWRLTTGPVSKENEDSLGVRLRLGCTPSSETRRLTAPRLALADWPR